MKRIRIALASLCLAATTGSAMAQTSPPLQIPLATLNAALKCTVSPGLAGATKTPVLLVHGTAVSADASWGATYAKVLPAQGYPVCTVDLPGRALGDIQDSAEYVVQAVRTMYAASGRKVSMIGHSQGGIITTWVMKFWPDLTPMVDDVINLAGAHHGTLGGFACAIPGFCGAAAWQFGSSSNLIAALNRKPLPAGPSFTSILSLTDAAVTPQPYGSLLDGGTNIALQTRCPGRPVGHVGILADAHAYDIVKDAITHAGPASITRLPLGTCLDVYLPGINLAKWNETLTLGLLEGITDLVNQPNPVPSEPPVRAYAQ